LFGIHPIGVRDNFFELGGHSLLAVRLFAQIEQSLGVNVPLAVLLQAPTIEQLAQTLDRANWHESWSSLVPLQPKGDRPPIFCIHGGGVNILIYRDLASQLGEEQPVYALQARGLDGRTKPHTTVEEMAAAYIEHIRTVQPEGPYFLAGLSHGGVVALEMAQQLRRQDQEVALLAMFDTYGPGQREFLPPIPRLFSVINYLVRYSLPQYLRRSLRGESKLSLMQIVKRIKSILKRRLKMPGSKSVNGQQKHQLTQESEVLKHISEIDTIVSGSSYLERVIHKLNMFVLEHSTWIDLYKPSASLKDIHGIQSRVVQELEGIHAQASRDYIPYPYLGRMIIFRAVEQPPGFSCDSSYGWSEIAAGGIEVYNVPGNHLTIMQSPVLAKKLQACLDKLDK
jgi:thioesterase domain-containing protein/aryl carrier-like protein